MADFLLRPATEGDREQIIKIWQEAFGDGEGFIEAMLSCGLMESAVGTEMDGALRCCMFAFDGLKIGGMPAAYLYALCTEKAYRGRGLGQAVTMYAAEAALTRGAEAVFLRPGDEALERWYSDVLGAVPTARGREQIFRPSLPAVKKARELSPEEYLRLRPARDWEPGARLMAAQGVVNRWYGGDFLEADGALVCAEYSCGRVLVREMISDTPEDTLAAVAEYFNAEELYILVSSGEGLPLMALPVGKAPPIPGATPLLPFTLD